MHSDPLTLIIFFFYHHHHLITKDLWPHLPLSLYMFMFSFICVCIYISSFESSSPQPASFRLTLPSFRLYLSVIFCPTTPSLLLLLSPLFSRPFLYCILSILMFRQLLLPLSLASKQLPALTMIFHGHAVV